MNRTYTLSAKAHYLFDSFATTFPIGAPLEKVVAIKFHTKFDFSQNLRKS